MRLGRLLLALAVTVSLCGVAYVAQLVEPAGDKMTTAAEKFLDGLSAEQKAKATFAFDDKERINWHFVPLQDKDKKPTRKGVRLEEMSPAQKDAARALIKTGTSETGYKSALTIMSLESILHDLEKSGTNI